MDVAHVTRLIQQYCTSHNGTVEEVVPGFWTLNVKETKVTVQLFPQPTRWGDLTSLIVYLDLPDGNKIPKYRYAWSNYPLNDQVAYESFEAAVNGLFENYQEDQEFERQLRRKQLGTIKRS